MGVVNQRDADLLFMWHLYKKTEANSIRKTEILKQITETMRHRNHVDKSIELIGFILYEPEKCSTILNFVRAPGLPLVDDWKCLKSMVRLFKTHCGSLAQYEMKHMRAFVNVCNGGITREWMEEASVAACSGYEAGQLHPSKQGCQERGHNRRSCMNPPVSNKQNGR